jgi:hypothetical protein
MSIHGWRRQGASTTVLLAAIAFASLTPTFAQGGRGPNPEADAAARAMPTPHTADGHPDLTGYWAAPPPALNSTPAKVSADGKTTSFGVDTPKTLIAARAAGGGRGSGGSAGAPGATAGAPPNGTPPAAAAGAAPNGAPGGGGAGGGRGGRGAGSKPEYKPELLAKVKDLHDHTSDIDTEYFCLPNGVPRMGAPTEIFQSPNAVAFLYEDKNYARVIPTDGRAHDPTADYSFTGDSVGHWEGDTLVIDVTRLTDRTWFAGESGYFHTQDLHVVERLTRQGNTILYEVTADDPNVLVKPWVLTPRTLRLGQATQHLVEDPPCLEQDQQHLVDKYHINP